MAGLRKDRAWIAGGVALAVVLAAAGWFLLISPQFGAANDADAQLADAQTQNIVLQKRLDTLREKDSHSGELKDALREAQAAIPPQHDVAGFTRQLTTFAADAGITVTSISPGSPTQVVLPETEAPDADDTGASASAPPTETSSDSAAPTSSTEAGPAGNLYSIAITVVTTGPMSAQQTFLSSIEKQGDRRALVTGAAFTPIDEDPAAANSSAQQSAASGTGQTGTEDESGASGDGAASTQVTAAISTVPTTLPPASATNGQWTLTTQLLIFVAPQSPDQEAQLLDQLGGNG